MGNNDKSFWGLREQRKKISGSREHELKTFLGTRGFINGEQGIKSKKIKGSREHDTPPPPPPPPRAHPLDQPTPKKTKKIKGKGEKAPPPPPRPLGGALL